MKFNNIITEAIIDSADIPKTAKNILKYIFSEYAKDSNMGLDRSQFLNISIDLSQKFGITITDAIKSIELYEKYKDIFFNESIIKDFVPEIHHDNSETFMFAVTEYIYNKYNNQKIYESGRVSADLYFFTNPKDLLKDEMLSYVNAYISVDFSDVKEFFEISGSHVWTINLHTSYNVYEREKVGYDLIDNEEIASHADEEGDSYVDSEIISSGWIKSTYFNPPKYFVASEVEKFGERVVDVIRTIIRKHHHKLEGFGDWLQHGGYVFENHKKR